MTINQFKALFRDIGAANFFIKTTEFGEPPSKVDANIDSELYPAFYQIKGDTIVRETTEEHYFNLIVCDLVFPGKENLDEVLSDTQQTLGSIVKILRYENFAYTLINEPVMFNFKDRYGDAVAGWEVEVIIETQFNDGYCDIPSDVFGFPGGEGTAGLPLEPQWKCSDLLGCQLFNDVQQRSLTNETNIVSLSNSNTINVNNIISLSNSIIDLQNDIRIDNTELVYGTGTGITSSNNLTFDGSDFNLVSDTTSIQGDGVNDFSKSWLYLDNLESSNGFNGTYIKNENDKVTIFRNYKEVLTSIGNFNIFGNLTGSSFGIDRNTNNTIFVSGDGKGIQYNSNYNSTFASSSLVDKRYVDNLVSTIVLLTGPTGPTGAAGTIGIDGVTGPTGPAGTSSNVFIDNTQIAYGTGTGITSSNKFSIDNIYTIFKIGAQSSLGNQYGIQLLPYSASNYVITTSIYGGNGTRIQYNGKDKIIFSDETGGGTILNSSGSNSFIFLTVNSLTRLSITDSGNTAMSGAANYSSSFVNHDFTTTRFNINDSVSTKINSLSGSGNRMVEATTNGTMSAIQEIVEQFITAGGAAAILLENVSNWNILGVYIGTAITNTYKGQTHYDSNYLFMAYADNLWLRTNRV